MQGGAPSETRNMHRVSAIETIPLTPSDSLRPAYFFRWLWNQPTIAFMASVA
jgi:hypothetical protein